MQSTTDTSEYGRSPSCRNLIPKTTNRNPPVKIRRLRSIDPVERVNSLITAADRDKMKREISYIISPGSAQSKRLSPPKPLPTGGTFQVLQQTRQIDTNFSPDASGSVLLLLAPFFEAPLIRIVLNADFTFNSWYAFQLPGYESINNANDPLKAKHIYAYRFVASSLTAYMTSPMTTSQGQVNAWYQPLSLDTKKVYTATGDNPANPIMNMRTLDRVPITVQQISGVSKEYYQGSATEGAYIVSRHTDPNVPFTYRDCDENKAMVSLYTLNSAGLQPILSDGYQRTYFNYLCYADDLVPGAFLRDGPEPTSNPIPVSAPTCMDLSCVLFSGLGVNQGNTISVKTIVTVEQIPKYNADTIGFATPMVPRNDKFMKALARAEQRAPRVGNAESNSIGTFLNGLTSVLNTIAPVAKVVSSALPPQYGMMVSSIADTLPKLTSAVNNVVNNNKQTQKQVKVLADKLSQNQTATMPNVLSNYTIPTQQFSSAARRPVSLRPR